MVWTGGPGNWTGARLSTACLTDVQWSSAQSIGREGSPIGGRAVVTTGRNKSKQLPVLWDNLTSNCRVLALPAGVETGTGVNQVNGLGMAVGGASTAGGMRAVVWDAAGIPTILVPVSGDAFSGAHAIAPYGQIVVGVSGNRSTYWVRTETGWSAGIPLTNTCGGSSQTWARGVNDDGVIVGSACDGGRWWRVANGVVTETGRMPGLGPTDHPIAEAISNNSLPGTAWAAGGGAGATFWRVP
jgi:uncharacterized membrane protein